MHARQSARKNGTTQYGFCIEEFSFILLVACTFSCTLKFVVKDCDPNTGEPDEEGYEDEYVVRKLLWLNKQKYKDT